MLTSAAVGSGPLLQDPVARVETAVRAMRVDDPLRPGHLAVQNHVIGALLSRALFAEHRFGSRRASVIVEKLFARTRALAGFLMKPSGAHLVANPWKVLETARVYEAAAPATLRAFVRFLQDEEASSRAEGDSPVAEAIGASVELVAVHKAKSPEYPIVIVAQLFTDKTPQSDCIVDHAAKQGWLKIGPFAPAGVEERKALEQHQEAAERRRLLDVSLTRARDHLVVPCPPGIDVNSGLGLVANVLVRDAEKLPDGKREESVTGFDPRRLAFGVQGPTVPVYSAAVEGSAADARTAQAAEQAWLDARRAARKQASRCSCRW